MFSSFPSCCPILFSPVLLCPLSLPLFCTVMILTFFSISILSTVILSFTFQVPILSLFFSSFPLSFPLLSFLYLVNVDSSHSLSDSFLPPTSLFSSVTLSTYSCLALHVDDTSFLFLLFPLLLCPSLPSQFQFCRDSSVQFLSVPLCCLFFTDDYNRPCLVCSCHFRSFPFLVFNSSRFSFLQRYF